MSGELPFSNDVVDPFAGRPPMAPPAPAPAAAPRSPLENLTTEDLLALRSGNLEGVSTAGLLHLRGGPVPGPSTVEPQDPVVRELGRMQAPMQPDVPASMRPGPYNAILDAPPPDPRFVSQWPQQDRRLQHGIEGIPGDIAGSIVDPIFDPWEEAGARGVNNAKARAFESWMPVGSQEGPQVSDPTRPPSAWADAGHGAVQGARSAFNAVPQMWLWNAITGAGPRSVARARAEGLDPGAYGDVLEAPQKGLDWLQEKAIKPASQFLGGTVQKFTENPFPSADPKGPVGLDLREPHERGIGPEATDVSNEVLNLYAMGKLFHGIESLGGNGSYKGSYPGELHAAFGPQSQELAGNATAAARALLARARAAQVPLERPPVRAPMAEVRPAVEPQPRVGAPAPVTTPVRPLVEPKPRESTPAATIIQSDAGDVVSFKKPPEQIPGPLAADAPATSGAPARVRGPVPDDVELPEEITGLGKTWGRPAASEGTVPTAGERAVNDYSIEDLARRAAADTKRDIRPYTDKQGNEFLFDNGQVKKGYLSYLDRAAKGRSIWRLVNGTDAKPAEGQAREVVQVRDRQGREVRSVLASTPEEAAAAEAAQPQGLKVERKPATDENLRRTLTERTAAPHPRAAELRAEAKNYAPHDEMNSEQRFLSDEAARGFERVAGGEPVGSVVEDIRRRGADTPSGWGVEGRSAGDDAAEHFESNVKAFLSNLETKKASESAGPEGDALLEKIRQDREREFGKKSAPTAAPRFERLPIEDIHYDPARFQGKTRSNRLGHIEKFDEGVSDPIDVWKDPQDGKTYVVNGHSRFNAAKRLKETHLDVRYVDAPDAAAARRFGMEKNLAQGSVEPDDAARFMRESGKTGEELNKYLREKGIAMTADTVRRGRELANLEPGLWERYLAGTLRESRAVAIGESGLEAKDQVALEQFIRRKKIHDDEIPHVVDLVKNAAQGTKKATGGLFDMGDEEVNLFPVQAKLREEILKRFGSEERVLKMAAKRESTLAKAGNVIDAAQSRSMAEGVGQAGEVVRRLMNVKGPVADAIRTAAEKLHGGDSWKETTNWLEGELLDAVRAELGRNAKSEPPAEKAPEPKGGLFDAQGRPDVGSGPAPAPPVPGQGSLFKPPASTSGKPGEIVRESEIIKQLETTMDRPIRVGTLGKRGVLGFYRPFEEIVRLKHANDTSTAAHEIGHALEAKEFAGDVASASVPIHVKGDLHRLGKLLYGKKRPAISYASEGLAELIREFVEHKGAVKNALPATRRWFETVLDGMPEYRKGLEEARDMAQRFEDQGPEGRMEAFQHVGKKPLLERIGDAVASLKKNPARPFQLLNRAWLNDLEVLERFAKEAKAPAIAEAAQQFVRSASSRAAAFVETGDLFTDMGGGPGLKEILEPVGKAGKTREFRAVVASRRALDYWKSGLEPGLRREDVAYVLKYFDKGEVAKAADLREQWRDRLMFDTLVRRGGVSPKVFDALRTEFHNEHYAHFMRMFPDVEGDIRTFTEQGGRQGTAIEGTPHPVRRRTGSFREIRDVLEADVADAGRLISLGDRLQLSNGLARVASSRRGLGRWFEEVPKEKARVQFQAWQIGDYLERLKGMKLTKAEREEALTVFVNKPRPTGENVITLWRNGKRKWFQVHPEMAEALSRLDAREVDGVFRALGYFSKLQKLGAVVYNVGFQVANPIKDIPMYLLTGTKRQVPVYTAVKNLTRGFAHSLFMPHSEAMRAYKSSGAESGGYWGYDRDFTADVVKQLSKKTPETAAEKAAQVIDVRNWPRAVKELASRIEGGTRVAEFLTSLENDGWDHKKGPPTAKQITDAALKAQDVTVNFKRMGEFGAKWNVATAFFNPSIQAIDKLARNAKSHPVRVTARGLAYITAPTMALWAATKDDENVHGRPGYLRYGYWMVPFGDGENDLVKIPMPHAIGSMFAALPIAIADYVHGKNPEAFGEWYGQFKQQMTPPLIPTAAQGAIDVWGNTQSYTGRDIVPPSLADAPKEQQYLEGTSAAARAAAPHIGLSPLALDYLLNYYTGNAWREADDLVEQGTGIREPSSRTKIPIASRFTITGVESRDYDAFWKLRREIEESQAESTIVRRDPARARADMGRAVDPAALEALSGEARRLQTMRRDYFKSSGAAKDAIGRQFMDTAKRARELAERVHAQSAPR